MAAPELDTALTTLVDCVTAALAEADRAVCDSGTTVGPPRPGQCCACDCGSGCNHNGQVSGNLERVYPADGTLLEQVTRLEDCRPGVTVADFTIVVIRCYPTMDEQGNMPELDATTEAATDLHTDLGIVWNALKCCGSKIVFRESAVDADPEGGCSAFAVRVTVPVTL